MPSLSQLIASRRQEWAQLESLLKRSEGNGLRGLSADELDALGRGYRKVMSDVALAQRDFPADQLTLSLNALAARAHMRLYRAPGASWKRVARFFWFGLPRRFRAAWPYVTAAAALFVLAAIGGYVAALTSPAAREALVPAEMLQVMARGDTWTKIEPGVRPGMAAFIFTHNIQVSFAAFAGGVLLGLGALYALVFNGLYLGAVFGAGQHYGVTPLLLNFVSAHGFIELTCIVIAGAAGLMIGDAELRPGLLRRSDAVTRAGRRAVELVLGTMPVFVVAGIVEGNLSPSGLPLPAKLAVGVGLWALLLAGLLTVGQGKIQKAKGKSERVVAP